MSSGERPITAAKGKQSDTEALCQPPPPPPVSVSDGLSPAVFSPIFRPSLSSSPAIGVVCLGVGEQGALHHWGCQARSRPRRCGDDRDRGYQARAPGARMHQKGRGLRGG